MQTLLLISSLSVLALACVASSEHSDGNPMHPRKSAMTFTRDIAPIIYSKCVSCHRPGQVAPFSLLSYEDVAKRADLIEQVVKSRAMPPWSPGPCDYPVLDDQSLSTEQIDAIVRWTAEGKKKGKSGDMPPKPIFKSTWKLGPPDLIVTMPKAYTVPSDGPDIYRNFVVPLNMDKDQYVSAIDFQPGTRTVVHHCLFYYDALGTARKHDGADGAPGYDGSMGNILGGRGNGDEPDEASGLGRPKSVGNLGGWAVGGQASRLPDGLAYAIPKGSDLILATHFHPTGKIETEQSTVGIYFSKKPPTRAFTSLLMPPVFGFFSHIDIPPGKKDYLLTDTYTLPVDVKAFGFSAHAHFLGKKMLLTATLPNGSTKTLLNIPTWDFNWQGGYTYAQFPTLPKGTKLSASISYDNSSDNVSNPSKPPKRVRWGEQTVNEMGSLILSVIPANQADFAILRKDYRKHLIAEAMRG